MRPIVVIPARMESSRLPDKPLAQIDGEPMIVHVWRRGIEADLGPVVVASGDPRIAAAIRERGGIAIDTDAALPSGSDRVAAALAVVDPARTHDVVVNLQGDMPTFEPEAMRLAVRALAETGFDVATLGCVIADAEELARPSVVKIAMEPLPGSDVLGRAHYFSRAPIPVGAPVHLHHIGLYVYARDALTRFVAAPQGALERSERLEQLRALALGMSIAVRVVTMRPLGVDTAADLDEARRRLRA